MKRVLWYKTPAEIVPKAVTMEQLYTGRLVQMSAYNGPGEQTEFDGWEYRALPIGNGHMGGMVFGTTNRERIQFNEKTLWEGGPGSHDGYSFGNKPGAAQYLPEVRRLLEEGKMEEAYEASKQLLEQEMKGFGGYQSFGDIFVELNGHEWERVDHYRRELDLDEGIARVRYDLGETEYTREYFCSYPAHLMVLRLCANGKDTLTAKILPKMHHVNVKTTVQEDTIVIRGRLGDEWVEGGDEVRGVQKSNEMGFESILKVITDGQMIDVQEGILVAGAREVVVLMTCGTEYACQYPHYRKELSHEELMGRILAGEKQGYEALRREHITDHAELFGRVDVSLGGEEEEDLPTDQLLAQYRKTSNRRLEELMYAYGRYLLIASSRDGSLPANLQGVWNDKNAPAWCCDYHFNINVQMNYWHSEQANLTECSNCLVDYVESLVEPGTISAREHFGTEHGWVVNTMNNPFGYTAPGRGLPWGWAPNSGAFICRNLWEKYQFHGDVEYLREKIYPLMKGVCEFWVDFLYEDPQGFLVSSPSFSPEHGPCTAGAKMDQQLVWEVFTNTIKAAEILQVDSDFCALLREKLAKLAPPLEKGSWGQLKEWGEDLDDPKDDHRHVSHLVALYPGDQINRKAPEFFDAAKTTLIHRGDDSTGWSRAWKTVLWARLLDGNHAFRILNGQLRLCTNENLFDVHPPFQIDGNFGYSAAMGEMLMQSHLGVIEFLPALPDEWQTGSFRGLMARGAFEISAQWKDGKMQRATVISKCGNFCRVLAEGLTVTRNGVPVATQKQEDEIGFATEAGGVYQLQF